MEKGKNTIRLNEGELKSLIEEAVVEILNEGRFGDFAKKVGKGLGKAALYGAIGAGSVYCMDQGLENQNKYEQEVNRQAKVLQGPSKNDVTKWIQDNGMEDTPENREAAWEYLNNMLQDEGKITNESVDEVIKEGSTDTDINNKWETAQTMMGADNMLDALYSYLDEDTIADFIETLEQVYELPFDEYLG